MKRVPRDLKSRMSEDLIDLDNSTIEIVRFRTLRNYFSFNVAPISVLEAWPLPVISLSVPCSRVNRVSPTVK